jgi:hypothetical protein
MSKSKIELTSTTPVCGAKRQRSILKKKEDSIETNSTRCSKPNRLVAFGPSTEIEFDKRMPTSYLKRTISKRQRRWTTFRMYVERGCSLLLAYDDIRQQ